VIVAYRIDGGDIQYKSVVGTGMIEVPYNDDTHKASSIEIVHIYDCATEDPDSTAYLEPPINELELQMVIGTGSAGPGSTMTDLDPVTGPINLFTEVPADIITVSFADTYLDPIAGPVPNLFGGDSEVEDEGEIVYALHIDNPSGEIIPRTAYAKVLVHDVTANTNQYVYGALNPESGSPQISFFATEDHGHQFTVTIVGVVDGNTDAAQPLAEYQVAPLSATGPNTEISDSYTLENDPVIVSITYDNLRYDNTSGIHSVISDAAPAFYNLTVSYEGDLIDTVVAYTVDGGAIQYIHVPISGSAQIEVQYAAGSNRVSSIELVALYDYDPARDNPVDHGIKLLEGSGEPSLITELELQMAIGTGPAMTDLVSVTGPVTLVTADPSDLVAPIALDLNDNGVIAYLEQTAGVYYDYAHDGHPLLTAWVAPEDGLLAMQNTDGSLNIVFSTQEGETDLQGLAKVYDSNHDGVLDAKDVNFAQFGVWQDLNSDGKVEDGEFLSLSDRNITSLSLTSDGQLSLAANGQVLINGNTSFTTNDGVAHLAQDVGFAVTSENHRDYHLADFSALLSGAQEVHATISIDPVSKADSSSSLFIELGGQTYEIANLKGEEFGGKDILAHFVGGDAAKGIDSNAWTEVVDIASIHGGPASISADGGILANGYENKAGDWTVIVKSGQASVDADSKQIIFSSDHADNAVTIVTADGTSHDIQHVDKVQWHG